MREDFEKVFRLVIRNISKNELDEEIADALADTVSPFLVSAAKKLERPAKEIGKETLKSVKKILNPEEAKVEQRLKLAVAIKQKLEDGDYAAVNCLFDGEEEDRSGEFIILR